MGKGVRKDVKKHGNKAFGGVWKKAWNAERPKGKKKRGWKRPETLNVWVSLRI